MDFRKIVGEVYYSSKFAARVRRIDKISRARYRSPSTEPLLSDPMRSTRVFIYATKEPDWGKCRISVDYTGWVSKNESWDCARRSGMVMGISLTCKSYFDALYDIYKLWCGVASSITE